MELCPRCLGVIASVRFESLKSPGSCIYFTSSQTKGWTFSLSISSTHLHNHAILLEALWRRPYGEKKAQKICWGQHISLEKTDDMSCQLVQAPRLNRVDDSEFQYLSR